MSNIRAARNALVRRILEGDGRASRDRREAAFRNAGLVEPLATLARKIAQNASAVGDADVAAALGAGSDEDQIFEVMVCAAIGEASRQYDAALAILEAAASERSR